MTFREGEKRRRGTKNSQVRLSGNIRRGSLTATRNAKRKRSEKDVVDTNFSRELRSFARDIDKVNEDAEQDVRL